MKERENQVLHWRDIADETHPAGPLFRAGIHAEADIIMAGIGPTCSICTDQCTMDTPEGGCFTRA